MRDLRPRKSGAMPWFWTHACAVLRGELLDDRANCARGAPRLRRSRVAQLNGRQKIFLTPAASPAARMERSVIRDGLANGTALAVLRNRRRLLHTGYPRSLVQSRGNSNPISR